MSKSESVMNEGVTEYKYSYYAWIEAFCIFAKYEPSALRDLSAEHDQIFASDTSVISLEDRKRLEDLGWYADDELERFVRGV